MEIQKLKKALEDSFSRLETSIDVIKEITTEFNNTQTYDLTKCRFVVKESKMALEKIRDLSEDDSFNELPEDFKIKILMVTPMMGVAILPFTLLVEKFEMLDKIKSLS